jgi:Flp pilus assembly protein TadB
LPDSEKTGKDKKALERLRAVFKRRKPKPEEREEERNEKEIVIEHGGLLSRFKPKVPNSADKSEKLRLDHKDKTRRDKREIAKLNPLQKFAYLHLSPSLPTLPGYRDAYEQAGLPLIYESYLSTALLLSFIASLPTFALSLFFENRILKIPLLLSAIGSVVLGFVAFAVSLLVWLLYPLERRRSFKSKLERQLAYSFGILGALAAAGIGVERLFERLAATETNPVLAELSRRFLRNVKVFGLDTESALREVAAHSPSVAFSKMLESMAVAFRTTGSMHDLVMFESNRLFAEKKDKLKKNVSDLAVMAELYITLVVVGPIIFIVMLTIFTILPTNLLSPVILINVLVFLGIPLISVAFTLLLDSMVGRM